MRFAAPLYLLLLALLPLAGYYFFRLERRRIGTMRFPDVGTLKRVKRSPALLVHKIIPLIRIVALGLIILALARPQHGWVERSVTSEGVDIMLALDVSESMHATDFNPNRLEAAKEVITGFVEGREADSIGLVTFATTSFVLCPLTLDYGVIKDFLSEVDFGIIDGNSTAIGMGLAYSLDRLKDRESKSKVIVLLTDGENNAGEVNPVAAAEMARAFDIKIYTIGVGSTGMVNMPVDTMFGKRLMPVQVSIDEDTLTQIAEATGGRYFRATDRGSLEKIYKEIDELEKTKKEFTEHSNYEERMFYFVLAAIVLLLVEIVLRNTRFLRVP